MTSPPLQVNTFIGMTATEANAWVNQLMASSTDKVLAISYVKKVLSDDSKKIASDSSLLATLTSKIRSELTTTNPNYGSLFVNTTPSVFFWDTAQTMQSKWRFTSAQQSSLNTFLSSKGGNNDMVFYLVNQAGWQRGFFDVGNSIVQYRAVAPAPPTDVYGVLCGRVTDSLYAVITNAITNATANQSNYWRLTLIDPAVFDVHTFGSKQVPSANLGADSVFSTLAWSASTRVIDVATNTQCKISNSLEAVA